MTTVILKIVVAVAGCLLFSAIAWKMIERGISGAAGKRSSRKRYCRLTLKPLDEQANLIRPFAGILDVAFYCNMHTLLRLYLFGPDSFPLLEKPSKARREYGVIIQGKRIWEIPNGFFILDGHLDEIKNRFGSLQKAWQWSKQNHRGIMMGGSGLLSAMLDRLDGMADAQTSNLLEVAEKSPLYAMGMLS